MVHLTKQHLELYFISSPESSSLTPLFDTGSFTTSNPYHPDFVVKDPVDGTCTPINRFRILQI